MGEPMETYYTVPETAGLLKVIPRTVYRYIEEGKLEATKAAGGQWRVPQSAIVKFINGGRAGQEIGGIMVEDMTAKEWQWIVKRFYAAEDSNQERNMADTLVIEVGHWLQKHGLPVLPDGETV